MVFKKSASLSAVMIRSRARAIHELKILEPSVDIGNACSYNYEKYCEHFN
jgi:hypothetical protein